MSIGKSRRLFSNNFIQKTKTLHLHFSIFILMDILIITGGSKGIGKAIAEKYTLEKHTVFSISRSASNASGYLEITADLRDTDITVKAIKTVFNQIDSEQVQSITLINNAGTLGVINSLGKLTPKDIAQTIHLNTATPLIIANEFISYTKNWNCKKQIINISSGAALNPYEGWSVYCSSKAALNMTTRTRAAEQLELKNGVSCIAIAPGVVDTNMQTDIRKTSEVDFKNVQRFIDLKENNELYSPEFVASKIYRLDFEGAFNNGDILDIRSL